MLPRYKNKTQQVRAFHMFASVPPLPYTSSSVFTYSFETDSGKVAQAGLTLSIVQAKWWTFSHPISASGAARLTGRVHQGQFLRDTFSGNLIIINCLIISVIFWKCNIWHEWFGQAKIHDGLRVTSRWQHRSQPAWKDPTMVDFCAYSC